MVHDTVYCDKIDVKPVLLHGHNFRLSRSEQAMQLPLNFLEIVYWLACRTALKQELLQLGYSAVLFFFLAFFGCGNRFMGVTPPVCVCFCDLHFTGIRALPPFFSFKDSVLHTSGSVPVSC